MFVTKTYSQLSSRNRTLHKAIVPDGTAPTFEGAAQEHRKRGSLGSTQFALFGILLSLCMLGRMGHGQTLRVPFDFSQSEIGVNVTLNGEPLYILLDTGVDPSVIDTQRAESLHLKIDRNAGGRVSGIGNTKQPTVFPTIVQGFAISGHEFGSFDALTSDLSALSAKYGRRVDAFIGYSFLRDKIIMVDYTARTLSMFEGWAAATSASKSCRTRWSVPMQLLEGENWPLLPQFRLGDDVISATLDTGSSGSITLDGGVLDMPGVRSAMVEHGAVNSRGFQGEEKSKGYVFDKPVGFGPFQLPSAAVTLRDVKGSSPNVANVGNKFFASMGLKMLLDYRDRTMAFFGDCR